MSFLGTQMLLKVITYTSEMKSVLNINTSFLIRHYIMTSDLKYSKSQQQKFLYFFPHLFAFSNTNIFHSISFTFLKP